MNFKSFVKTRSASINDNRINPKTISVSGAYSGCGKTYIAERILKSQGDPHKPQGDPHKPQGDPHKPQGDPHKPQGSPHRWGAIKYTRTGLYTSIIETSEIINQEDKDTHRLIKAGAEQVIWVQSTPNDISEVIHIAIDRMNHLDGILVEGNGPVNVYNFDYNIFVFGHDINRFKESAKIPLAKAQIVIIPDASLSNTIRVLYDLTDKRIVSIKEIETVMYDIKAGNLNIF